MAEAIERVLTLRFQPDMSQVEAALTGLEQRASRAITFGTSGGGATTFSAEGPAIGGGAPPTSGGIPGGSTGAGGFRAPRGTSDDERVWAIRERTSLIGADPAQRIQHWQAKASDTGLGSLARSRAEEQVARAEQALAKAKEREAAAAERAAAAEEKRAATARKSSAREYATDDRAYQRESKRLRSAMARALKAGPDEGGPKSDLEAIAEAAEEVGDGEEGAEGTPARRAARGRGRRFNPGRGLYRFLGPYFIAQESLRIANANLEYRDESAIARTDDERMEATKKYNQSLLAIPIAGQGYNLYRNLTGKNRDEMIADRQLDDSKKDDAWAEGMYRKRTEDTVATDDINRRARTVRIGTDTGRRTQGLYDQYNDWQEKEWARIEGLRVAARESGLDPQERQRRTADWQYATNEFEKQKIARRFLRAGEQDEINREVSRRRADIGLDEPELRARLEGQPGIARERSFEAGLQRRQAEADRYNPQYATDVRKQNDERRRIEADDVVEKIRERDADAASVRATGGRQSQRASDIRFDEERRIARREAGSNPEDLRSRLDEIETRSRLDARQRNDAIFAGRAGILARNAALSFEVGDTTDPRGIAALRGTARSTVNSTLLSALRAGQEGDAGNIPEILKGGVLGLQLQARNYVQGFQPTEADPRRQITSGEGSADAGKVLRDIFDAIKALKDAPTDLKGIRETVDKRLGVAL